MDQQVLSAELADFCWPVANEKRRDLVKIAPLISS